MLKWNAVLSFAATLCVAVPVFCYAQQQSITGRFLEVHGNRTFVLPVPHQDTITVVDPVTGDSISQMRRRMPFPILVSGKKIYNNSDVTTPVRCKDAVIENTFEEHILKALKRELIQLPNGIYSLQIGDLVVDQHGPSFIISFLVWMSSNESSARQDIV